MWTALLRYRGVIAIGVLLLLPLLLLYAQTRSRAARGPVVSVIVDSAGIIERGMLTVTGAVSDGLERYFSALSSYDELIDLRRSEASRGQVENRVRELELENDRLRSLANLASRIDGPRPLGARVVGRSGAPLSRIARIDRGRADGVRRGDGVLSADGVVGRVLTAGRRHSDVLLLTDPSSALDIVVQRTRARGLLRGSGDETAYRARVEDFDRLADLETGDVVVTSGLDPHFPPGLVVGVITEVETREDGLYRRAMIRPAAALDRVEEVVVLLRRTLDTLPRVAPEPYRPVGIEGPPEPTPEEVAEAERIIAEEEARKAEERRLAWERKKAELAREAAASPGGDEAPAPTPKPAPSEGGGE